MNCCTFFGHRDAPKEIEPTLRSALIDLIENKNVDSFYVGNHGNFDSMVRKNLKSLKLSYPQIHYSVVLAYLPKKQDMFNREDYADTLYPEGMENTPPRYAICKRNRWMIDRCDFVVTYVRHTLGGSAKFKELAKKKGKIVLNLFDLPD